MDTANNYSVSVTMTTTVYVKPVTVEDYSIWWRQNWQRVLGCHKGLFH